MKETVKELLFKRPWAQRVLCENHSTQGPENNVTKILQF